MDNVAYLQLVPLLETDQSELQASRREDTRPSPTLVDQHVLGNDERLFVCFMVLNGSPYSGHVNSVVYRAKEPCESRGGRPGK